MTVLVTGGTGRLGRMVVEGLRAAGVSVRVLTRSVQSARTMRAEGVEVTVGRAEDPDDARAAVAGCGTVISAMTGFSGSDGSSPRSVDRDGNLSLIGAAEAAGVERFILTSVRGAAPDSPLELARMKHTAETALRASRLDRLIVRPAPFLETQLAAMAAPLETKGRTLLLGSRTTPIDMVPVRDVAAVILQAALGHHLDGRVIDMAGSRVTMQAMSDALHRSAGTSGRSRRVPIAALRLTSLVARPFDPFLARAAQAAVEMHRTAARGGLARATGATVVDMPSSALAEAVASTGYR